MASKSPKTFPTMAAKALADFAIILAGEFGVMVPRPELVKFLLGGGANRLAIVPGGKVRNAAWRTLHADECHLYADESGRNRQAGGSQVETVRAAIKKIADAYTFATGEVFPLDAVKLTGGEDGNVQIWRVR